MPKALETLPSIPANPRFAKVSIPSRGVANASTSLIGRDDEINKDEPELHYLDSAKLHVQFNHFQSFCH